MMVYVGQTRAAKLIADLSALGFGEMTNRGEAPPRRFPFALDNGAFKDWRDGAVFDENAFLSDLDLLRTKNLTPDFLVVPDKVAGGLASLDFSLSWVSRLKGFAPLYLAVQDGQSYALIAPLLGLFDGLFVGGTLGWKIAYGEGWVRLAHSHGKKAHIGRCGPPRRVAWAKRIGADSIDSCLPLWSKENLARFCAAVFETSSQLPLL